MLCFASYLWAHLQYPQGLPLGPGAQVGNHWYIQQITFTGLGWCKQKGGRRCEALGRLGSRPNHSLRLLRFYLLTRYPVWPGSYLTRISITVRGRQVRKWLEFQIGQTNLKPPSVCSCLTAGFQDCIGSEKKKICRMHRSSLDPWIRFKRKGEGIRGGM